MAFTGGGAAGEVTSASRVGVGAADIAGVVVLSVELDAAGVSVAPRCVRPTTTPPRKMTTDTTAAVMNKNARCLPVSWMSTCLTATWLVWIGSLGMVESTPGDSYSTARVFASL